MIKKNKLLSLSIALLILTFTDAVLTDIGLQNNWIVESNPFMSQIYSYNVIYFYLFKLLLAFIIILLIFRIKHTLFFSRLLTFAVVLYMEVLILHVHWLLKVY